MDIILSGNIDRHNPKFFDKVMNRLKEYPYHRITRRESEPLSKIVVTHFGLNDKFQLKDKFEGEAFYKNASCVFASILSINKILNFFETWKTKLTSFLANAESVIDRTQELVGQTKPDQVTNEETEESVEPQTEEAIVPVKNKKSKKA